MAAASPAEKDVWTASWIWPRRHVIRPWNTYVYFRKTLELARKPDRALIRISADARYTLYVNARRIHLGPARSFQSSQSFDTLDLAEYLEAGRNSLCAIVHQFGIPTFQTIYRGVSGFLLDGAVESGKARTRIDTAGDWLCREAKGWRKNVARLSLQLGFQEHYDADADPADWMLPDYQAKPEEGWEKPGAIEVVGAHPWLAMEPRGVPLLSDHLENFVAISGQFSGENPRGYKIVEDVYHLVQQESLNRGKGLLDHAEAMLLDSDEQTVVPPPPDGQFVAAVLDLGQYRTGHIHLDIADAAGDEIIDIIYSEDLDPKTDGPLIVGNADRPGDADLATADRYRCRPGRQIWESFWFKGMRYATLIFRNVEKPLRIRRVAVRQVHAGVEEIGAFECSDDRLNKIWRVGKETQRNCMFDSFVDCPWREQAQWWGDARVQARVTAYAFGDTSLLERGIRQVAQSQAADGSLHAHPPADVPAHRLPDFMLTWVASLWDYYFHTGKTDLLREVLPAMHRLFDFFERHELKEGLIGGFTGFWVFLDWKELFKPNFSAVLNFMYLAALRYAAAMCDILGVEAAATRYIRKAEMLTISVEKYFWDPGAKVWRDGWDESTGQQVEQVSQHANTLAVLLDLKPETHLAIARDVLLKSARTKRGKIITASPFFYAYVLEAMIEAGLRAEAIDLIREKWGEMIDAGATTFWEGWEPVSSRCHAWSASPVYHLSQQILGVVPVDVGWKQIRIAPVVGDLEFARGVVPSPLGPITVEWEKVEEDQMAVRVDLPAGIHAEFVGPLGESRSLNPGSHESHT